MEAAEDLKRLGLVWEEANTLVMVCDALALFSKHAPSEDNAGGWMSLELNLRPGASTDDRKRAEEEEREKYRRWIRSCLKRAGGLYVKSGAGEEYERVCEYLRERPEVSLPPACLHYFVVGNLASTHTPTGSMTVVRYVKERKRVCNFPPKRVETDAQEERRLVRPRGRDALVDAVELIREGEGKPVRWFQRKKQKKTRG